MIVQVGLSTQEACMCLNALNLLPIDNNDDSKLTSTDHCSHAEGSSTTATGHCSHAIGNANCNSNDIINDYRIDETIEVEEELKIDFD